jgi:hypothetical protein
VTLCKISNLAGTFNFDVAVNTAVDGISDVSITVAAGQEGQRVCLPTPLLNSDRGSGAVRLPLHRKTEVVVPRRTRLNIALWLMGAAIVLNIVLLFSGDTSPGWPIASVILLGGAGAAMLAQRREL